ncbi:TadE/TadG family type IV pilus assembly protein [Aureimonas psammosilenae]|uniref:TadE/TadG family type IV pilus assembly protein n=1 Tax=Aureimonas psammosilenae TaxID=2495496 RepID=UPI0012606E88|nr:TadE/TadG family type IV pilus assembly protein [Aureimonas psammosilenae]
MGGGGRSAGRASVASRFLRGRSGASAIEFALVATPFLMLLMMLFQISLFYFAKESLDDAVRSASRQIMVGKVPASTQSAEAFRNTLLCPRLLFGLECSAIKVDAYRIGLTSDAKTGTGIYQFVDKTKKALRSPSSAGGFCIGAANDYVFLDVSYTFTNALSALFDRLTGGGLKTIRSTSLFRNEPFATGGASC